MIELAPDASGIVIGSPGTGKTATALARAVALLEDGAIALDGLLMLSPTRQGATRLRGRLSATLTVPTAGPVARSVSAFAFQLVREAAVARGETPPQLLPAGDHDAILAELIEGDAELGETWPDELPLEVRRSREFRAELRAFLATCAEAGVRPDELERIAASAEVPAWRGVARLQRDVDYALGRARAAHRDPSSLLREAALLLGQGAGALALPTVTALRVVIVDDAQELTRGGVDLLAACLRRGIAVLAFGDPDIASGSFRGASPALFAELGSLLGERGHHVLRQQHRAAAALTELAREVTTAIGASGTVDHRVAPVRAAGEGMGREDSPTSAGAREPRHPESSVARDSGDVRVLIARSPYEEYDVIARAAREWHVRGDVPWRRIAIIAHDTRQVAQLEAELAVRDVPTRAVTAARPLGEEAVVSSLLRIVELGLIAPGERDAERITDALLSPYVGLDPLGVRRLRASLRIAELAAGGRRRAADLLIETIGRDAGVGSDEPGSERWSFETSRADRLAAMLRTVAREAAAGASVHELCWIIWERSGLEAVWARQSAGTGSLALEAHRSLDAVVALFGAAKRFAERDIEGGSAKARQFIAEILDSDVADDVLAASRSADTVAVLTPAAALGTEFDAVVIAGVQQGVWPNTRLRGGLLESWRLPGEIERARRGIEPIDVSVLDRRRDVLSEELRLFVRALSRARAQLVVTAVDDDDQHPSGLLALLPEPTPLPAHAGTPLTLRGLVAGYRRTLTTSPDTAARGHAAGQLAILARAGVAGADPEQWYGMRTPTTTGGLRDLGHEPVRLSPSRIEGFEACGLDFAVRSLGGDSSSFSAGVGTILHAAMESSPDGELATLRALVAERWGELEFEADWIGAQERAWAETLTLRLHEYLRTATAHGGRALGSEARFTLAVEIPEALIDGSTDTETTASDDELAAPRVWVVPPETDPADIVPAGIAYALLGGSIDRVEAYPDGRGEAVPADVTGERVVVMDLKTGRSEERVTAAKVKDDAQLAAYQLAVHAGAVPGAAGLTPGGARLVVLSKTLRGTHYRIAHQDAPDESERVAFLRRIALDAVQMAAESFTAQVDDHCVSDRFAVCRPHIVPAVSAS